MRLPPYLTITPVRPLYTTVGRERWAHDLLVNVQVRRWHSGWWWAVIRLVEPRFLWRPTAWVAITRAIRKAVR